MALDCVQTNPRNAVEAWGRVVKFDLDHDYLAEWRKEQAFNGLLHGKRDKSSGKYLNFDQPPSIRARFTTNTLIDEIKTPDIADKQACVAVFDKNSDPLKVKERTTQCGKGTSCQTIDKDGYFISAAKQAKSEAEKTSQGQVARGYCMRNPNNKANKKEYNERLQKAEDIIVEMQNELNALKGIRPYDCKK